MIEYITEKFLEKSISLKSSKYFIIKGSKETPTEISNGTAIDRNDFKTSHEQADGVMVQQAHKTVCNHRTDYISVLCDDTNVLIFLICFYWNLNLSTAVDM